MGKISFEQHAILIQLTGPFCFNVRGGKMQTKLSVNKRALPVPATSLCQRENEKKDTCSCLVLISALQLPFLFLCGVNIEP